MAPVFWTSSPPVGFPHYPSTGGPTTKLCTWKTEGETHESGARSQRQHHIKQRHIKPTYPKYQEQNATQHCDHPLINMRCQMLSTQHRSPCADGMSKNPTDNHPHHVTCSRHSDGRDLTPEGRATNAANVSNTRHNTIPNASQNTRRRNETTI